MESPAAEEILSVTELTEQIKGTLESHFSRVWVGGEISDISRPSSGHIYLTLKDGNSQIRGVIWRSVAQRIPFNLQDGQAVVCFGSVDVYAARGSYQLVVRRLEPQGVGALQLAFQQLQQRLAAEGLFAPDRKRPLPPFPRRIAFVTSPTGAAIRDFLEVAARRWPGIEILVIPAVVQGPTAAPSIVTGIRVAALLHPPIDILVVGRGGGSLEDLWCFNEEPVVRAIASSPIPVVSAVGHEIDVTLADLVADVRALTPSAAAEMIIPDASQLRAILDQMQMRLHRPMRYRLDILRQRLEGLADRPVFTRPQGMIDERSRKLDDLDLRARHTITSLLERRNADLQRSAASLAALSPLATLARGYSVTLQPASNDVVRSIAQLSESQTIVTRFTDGNATSIVQSIEPLDADSQTDSA